MKQTLLTSFSNSLLFVLIAINAVHAANIEEGVTHLNQTEFQHKATQADSVVIDIRTNREYNAGHIAGAKHIPLADIFSNSSLLDEFQDKDLVFYCHTGIRVKRLTDHLQDINHPNQNRLFHLKGDIRAWTARRLPLEKQ